eukprot:1064103-Amphidinium_carterae.1
MGSLVPLHRSNNLKESSAEASRSLLQRMHQKLLGTLLHCQCIQPVAPQAMTTEGKTTTNQPTLPATLA